MNPSTKRVRFHFTRRVEFLATLFLLFISVGGFQYGITTRINFPLLFWPIFVPLCAIRWRRILKKSKPLLYANPFIIWTALLAVLLQSPGHWDLPVVAFFQGTLLALYLFSCFSPIKQKHLFCLLGIIFLVLNFAFLALGLGHSKYGYAGILSHKNILGLVAGVFTMLITTERFSIKRSLITAVILVSFIFFITISSSRTAQISVAAACLSIFALRNWKKHRVLVGSAIIGTVIILTFGFLQLHDQMFAALSRTSDLTGRTTIWRIVISHFTENPFFGSGFDTFHVGAPVSNELDVFFFKFRPNHAHNTFLHILSLQGIVGLLLFMVSLVPLMISAIKKLVRLGFNKQYDLWSVSLAQYVLYFFYASLTETLILWGVPLYTTLFWLACFRLRVSPCRMTFFSKLKLFFNDLSLK